MLENDEKRIDITESVLSVLQCFQVWRRLNGISLGHSREHECLFF